MRFFQTHVSTVSSIVIQLLVHFDAISNGEMNSFIDGNRSIHYTDVYWLIGRSLLPSRAQKLSMTSFDINLPSDIFALKGNTFHDFLESMFDIEIKEIARLQGFSTAYSLIYSSRLSRDRFWQFFSSHHQAISRLPSERRNVDRQSWHSIRRGISHLDDSSSRAAKKNNWTQRLFYRVF